MPFVFALFNEMDDFNDFNEDDDIVFEQFFALVFPFLMYNLYK